MKNISKRISGNRLIRITLVLAGFGIACGQQPKPGVQAAAPYQAPAATQTAAPSRGTKPFAIVDPAVNMTAFTGTIPANWSFDGMLLVGPPCNNFNSVPPPIWRAVSPDGITAARKMAPILWAWGADGKPAQVAGCFPIARALTAYEFNHEYLLRILGATFVKDLPGPPQQNRWPAPTGQPPISYLSNQATFIVANTVNNVAVEERVETSVLCADTFMPFPRPAGTHLYSCIANVGRYTARQGNLEASEPLFKSISARMDPQWGQQRLAILQNAIQRQGAANMAILKDMQDKGAAITNRMHQAFVAQTQRSADSIKGDFIGNIERQSRIADDYCDYALDLQKRQSPTNGTVIKTSSQYTYTWVSNFGAVYNTNDGSDDPNRTHPGSTWTLQTNIH